MTARGEEVPLSGYLRLQVVAVDVFLEERGLLFGFSDGFSHVLCIRLGVYGV